MRGRIAGKYIFFEMLPSFLIGVLVFVAILLLFQALRLTEFLLMHEGSQGAIFKMVFYLSVSFLPAILPMALLFSVLLTYGRLSNDSEIVAFKAAGLSMVPLGAPAIFLGILVTFFSAQTTLSLAPWGNRQFEVLITELGSTKVVSTLKEGTFSEGFYDLVVYANRVDSKSGIIRDVFIYDGRNDTIPITIISKEGRVISPRTKSEPTLLRLSHGDIHRTREGTYTKVSFEDYDLMLSPPTAQSFREKSPPSLTFKELNQLLEDPKTKTDREKILTLETEFHKRLAIPIACFVFSVLGVGLGTVTNRRAVRAGGLILSLSVIVGYWVLYVAAESLARQGTAPASVVIWIPNIIFIVMGALSLRRAWE